MANLLKVDFKRVLKDKLFLVVCIVAAVFALMTPLLYVGIVFLAGGDFSNTGDMAAMLGLGIDAKSLFFASFSVGNNMGLVLPVLLSIILCKDFSQGTVRNKLISGKSRTSVFLSMSIVCFCVLFGVMILHALLTFLVSIIFFPYQSTEFVPSDIGYFFFTLFLEALIYLFISSLVSFLCVFAKNMGLTIVAYIAIIMIMTIVSSILQVAGIFLVDSTDKIQEIAGKIIEFIQTINIFNFSTFIGMGVEYSLKEILCYIISPLVGAGAFLSLGILKFNRKDLK